MTYQSEFEAALGLAKEHELTANGLCTETRLAEINDSLDIKGRQILVFSNVVVELESNGLGKLEVKRQFDEEKAAIFGKFVGFTRLRENYFTQDIDEYTGKSPTGVLLRKNYTENKYSFVPALEIEDPIDVFESIETDEVTSAITEMFSRKIVDLVYLATLVRLTSGNIRDVTILKSYLQSVALPNDLCQLVVAPKYSKTGDSVTKSKTRAHHVDENYRLSVIIEEKDSVPTLSFEHDSDDGETSTIITLRPSDIYDYVKI